MLVNKPPEIVVMPLDAVVLRLKMLKIKNINQFPFIDKPNSENISISIKTICFLGCLDFNGEITEIGKIVLLFPI